MLKKVGAEDNAEGNEDSNICLIVQLALSLEMIVVELVVSTATYG